MEEEELNFLKGLEAQNVDLKEKNTQLQTALSASAYASNREKNVIEYQLDTRDLLDKIEHFLRGDYIHVDDEGNESWQKQENTELIIFNDYGVNSVMFIIGTYLDKDTPLSRYDEMRINEILADLGDELTKWIFCNYEKMGMDTQYKKSRFGLIVLMLLHKIESAYRRAIGGRTSEDINTSKIFTESGGFGQNPLNRMPLPSPQKKFNLLRPSTW